MMGVNNQALLERSACLKMAAFEFLSFCIFVFSPSPAAFARLAANGFAIAPELLGLFNLIGAVVYILIAYHPSLMRLSDDVRSVVFFLASLPIMFYLVPLGIIIIYLGMSIVGLVYVLIFFIVLLVITAVFRGYSRRLEFWTLVVLAAFMFLCAYIFGSFSSAVPAAIPFPVKPLVFIAFLGGFGYVLMLTPVAEQLSENIHQLIFLLSEAVIPIYATILLMNALLFGGSIFPPFAFFDLSLLIALLSYPLIRGRHALSLGRH